MDALRESSSGAGSQPLSEDKAATHAPSHGMGPPHHGPAHTHSMEIETESQEDDVKAMRRRAAQTLMEGARTRAATSLLLKGCEMMHGQYSETHVEEYPTRPEAVRKKAFARMVGLVQEWNTHTHTHMHTLAYIHTQIHACMCV